VIADPLDWLFGLDQFGIKLGLENIQTIVRALGHPERSFRSVHIAGTNGKGSVTAMVAAACTAAGHRTARYTSPHLIDLSERFVVDGTPADASAMRRAVEDVRDIIERLRVEERLVVQPTFFEVTTAVGFELFRRAGAEVAVCEVGLGGRLDATNVLDPVATAITSIGFDHQQYLGTTLREIAREKAGIIKAGVPVVLGSMPAEALAEITSVAARVGAAVSAVEHYDPEALASGPQSADSVSRRVHLRSSTRDYGDIRLSLPGDHQVGNALVAIRLLEFMDAAGISMPLPAIVHGLEHAAWPGRLDLRRLTGGREILLDAAHNPDGAAALVQFLTAAKWSPVPIVFGVMRDKDVETMLHMLAGVSSTLFLTRAANPRSADPLELAERVRRMNPELPVVVEPDPLRALERAWQTSSRIVLCGSIFLIGDLLKELERNEA
jgi:dihydrofolate synthase/folylpolyglutamate synthase